jgi:hypothetical protein
VEDVNPFDQFDQSQRSESPDPLDVLPRLPHAFAAALEESLDADGFFNLASSDPTGWSDSQKTTNAVDWEAATIAEIQKLEKLRCWDLVNGNAIPHGHRAIRSKFVLKSKWNKNGKIIQCKGQLVGQGFSQHKGRDYKETFAPILKFTSICGLITLAAHNGYHVEQADVDSAYIQANLDPSEVIYINLPDGMRHRPKYVRKVLKLRKALYGLKQSGRLWNKRIHASLTALY